MIQEENLNQVLLDLHVMGSSPADPHLRNFLENHFLAEEAKLIKEMVNCLTHLQRLASPHAGVEIQTAKGINSINSIVQQISEKVGTVVQETSQGGIYLPC